MRAKLFAFSAVLLLGLSTLAASAQQPPAEPEPTRCEVRTIEIAEHAVRYSGPASRSLDPFTQADGFAKTCGVLVRGLAELEGMGCPFDIVGRVREALRKSRETLDNINSRYNYRFNCFVPDFG